MPAVTAVVVVFVVWFAIVIVAGALSVALAPRLRAPGWLCAARTRVAAATSASNAAVGRIVTGSVLALFGWSVVLISGWLLGMLAHQLQPSIDWPSFHWWQEHYRTGTWHKVWWKLTNVGSPTVTQVLTVVGAVVMLALYARRRDWWAPSAALLIGYLAEKFSQIILKDVVHRGHPPTTMGTWPSGGMGRLILVYGLIIFFLVKRFWPESPRMWALGWSILALAASVQAYARLNNLEHWTTDVVGGGIYGLLLLLTMILGYSAWGRVSADVPDSTPNDLGARPRERVAQ